MSFEATGAGSGTTDIAICSDPLLQLCVLRFGLF
jgi:hypothetical protein